MIVDWNADLNVAVVAAEDVIVFVGLAASIDAIAGEADGRSAPGYEGEGSSLATLTSCVLADASLRPRFAEPRLDRIGLGHQTLRA
jgi:hypothetical protein